MGCSMKTMNKTEEWTNRQKDARIEVLIGSVDGIVEDVT